MYLRIILTIAALLLSACSTTKVGLKYTADSSAAKVSATAPPVIVGTFLDQRDEEETRLGVIRGGVGNPLKYLEAERPVAELVKTAFSDGLRARGVVLDQSSPQNQITGVIKMLHCSQLVRRDAHVDIEILVVDKAGQQRFSRLYKSRRVNGKLGSSDVGIFASVDDLRAVLENTLLDVVNQALDDNELRLALQL